MEQTNVEFPSYTPDYVLDEINYYFKKIKSGKSDVFTLDNAITLVNLAVVNEGITKEQGNIIKRLIRNLKNKY